MSNTSEKYIFIHCNLWLKFTQINAKWDFHTKFVLKMVGFMHQSNNDNSFLKCVFEYFPKKCGF